MTDALVNEKALEKLLLTLESDLGVGGWDQTTKMYAIAGNVDDPHLDLIMEFVAHPCEVLQNAWDAGHHLRPGLHGLVMASEAWRHLDFDEMSALDPEQFANMRAAIRAAIPGITEEEVTRTGAKAWAQFCLEQPGPSSMPEDRRVEMRSVMAVLLDGTSMGVVRDRTKDEPVCSPLFDAEFTLVGQVSLFMHKFVNNERPEHNLNEDEARQKIVSLMDKLHQDEQ